MHGLVKPAFLLTFLAICFTPATAMACKAKFYPNPELKAAGKGYVSCVYAKRKKEKLRKKAANFCENKGYVKEKTVFTEYQDCGKFRNNRCRLMQFICKK